LFSTNEDVHESIRPLLKLSRDAIVRLQKTEYALVSSLQRDPLLADRIKRLRTVPGVGPIPALTCGCQTCSQAHRALLLQS